MYLGQDEVYGPPVPSTDLLTPGGGFWSEIGTGIQSFAKTVAPLAPAAANIFLQSQKLKASEAATANLAKLKKPLPGPGNAGLSPTTTLPLPYGFSMRSIPSWAIVGLGVAAVVGFVMMRRR